MGDRGHQEKDTLVTAPLFPSRAEIKEDHDLVAIDQVEAFHQLHRETVSHLLHLGRDHPAASIPLLILGQGLVHPDQQHLQEHQAFRVGHDLALDKDHLDLVDIQVITMK